MRLGLYKSLKGFYFLWKASCVSIPTKMVSKVSFFIILLAVNSVAKLYRLQRNFQKILRDFSTDFSRMASQIPRRKTLKIILVISTETSPGTISGNPTGISAQLLLRVCLPKLPKILQMMLRRIFPQFDSENP